MHNHMSKVLADNVLAGLESRAIGDEIAFDIVPRFDPEQGLLYDVALAMRGAIIGSLVYVQVIVPMFLYDQAEQVADAVGMGIEELRRQRSEQISTVMQQQPNGDGP